MNRLLAVFIALLITGLMFAAAIAAHVWFGDHPTVLAFMGTRWFAPAVVAFNSIVVLPPVLFRLQRSRRVQENVSAARRA
ncbi:MAG TPA: hypothetical protein VIJ85_03140 [Rhizomicrobium sp.]